MGPTLTTEDFDRIEREASGGSRGSGLAAAQVRVRTLPTPPAPTRPQGPGVLTAADFDRIEQEARRPRQATVPAASPTAPPAAGRPSHPASGPAASPQRPRTLAELRLREETLPRSPISARPTAPARTFAPVSPAPPAPGQADVDALVRSLRLSPSTVPIRPPQGTPATAVPPLDPVAGKDVIDPTNLHPIHRPNLLERAGKFLTGMTPGLSALDAEERRAREEVRGAQAAGKLPLAPQLAPEGTPARHIQEQHLARLRDLVNAYDEQLAVSLNREIGDQLRRFEPNAQGPAEQFARDKAEYDRRLAALVQDHAERWSPAAFAAFARQRGATLSPFQESLLGSVLPAQRVRWAHELAKREGWAASVVSNAAGIAAGGVAELATAPLTAALGEKAAGLLSESARQSLTKPGPAALGRTLSPTRAAGNYAANAATQVLEDATHPDLSPEERLARAHTAGASGVAFGTLLHGGAEALGLARGLRGKVPPAAPQPAPQALPRTAPGVAPGAATPAAGAFRPEALPEAAAAVPADPAAALVSSHFQALQRGERVLFQDAAGADLDGEFLGLGKNGRAVVRTAQGMRYPRPEALARHHPGRTAEVPSAAATPEGMSHTLPVTNPGQAAPELPARLSLEREPVTNPGPTPAGADLFADLEREARARYEGRTAERARAERMTTVNDLSAPPAAPYRLTSDGRIAPRYHNALTRQETDDLLSAWATATRRPELGGHSDLDALREDLGPERFARVQEHLQVPGLDQAAEELLADRQAHLDRTAAREMAAVNRELSTNRETGRALVQDAASEARRVRAPYVDRNGRARSVEYLELSDYLPPHQLQAIYETVRTPARDARTYFIPGSGHHTLRDLILDARILPPDVVRREPSAMEAHQTRALAWKGDAPGAPASVAPRTGEPTLDELADFMGLSDEHRGLSPYGSSVEWIDAVGEEHAGRILDALADPERYQAAEARLQDRRAQASAGTGAGAVSAAMRSQRAPRPSLTEQLGPILDRAEQAARERLDARSGRLHAGGLDPEDLADLSVIGAVKIARGATSFVDWAADMLREFGERVRPHLHELWTHAAGHYVTRLQSQLPEGAPLPELVDVGEHGPRLHLYRHDAQGAIEALRTLQTGEAVAALHHPEVGDFDLIWGEAGTGRNTGYGLAKIAARHPEVLQDLQGVIDPMRKAYESPNSIRLASDTHTATVRLNWFGREQRWLLTAFEKKNPSGPGGSLDGPGDPGGAGGTGSPGPVGRQTPPPPHGSATASIEAPESPVNSTAPTEPLPRTSTQGTGPRTLADVEGGRGHLLALPPALRDFRVDKFRSPDELKAALDSALLKTASRPEFQAKAEAQRRGTVSHAETAKAAQELGLTVDEARGLLAGTALNAEQLDALGSLFHALREHQHQASEAFRRDPSPENRAAALAATAEYTGVLTSYLGARAEAGRALGILRRVKQALAQIPTGERAGAIFEPLGRRVDPAARTFGAENRFFTKAKALAARQRLLEKASRLNSGLDPTLLPDLVELGGYYVEGGLREFGAWAGRMRADVGAWLTEDHLREVWGHIRTEAERRAPKSAAATATGKEQVLQRLLSELGDSLDVDALSRDLATVPEDDAFALNRVLLRHARYSLWDKVRAYDAAGLLSSVSGLTRDMVSTGLFNAVEQTVKVPVRAAIDSGLARATGRQRQFYAGELGAGLQGWFRAQKAAVGSVSDLIRHGMDAEAAGQFEVPRYQFPDPVPGKVPNPLNLPGRLRASLGGSYWKVSAMGAELSREAFRIAAEEGRTGNARQARMQELLQLAADAAGQGPQDRSPLAKRLLDTAEHHGEYATFQGDPGGERDPLLRGMLQVRDRSKVLQFLFPFVRTSYLIGKRTAEFTPYGFAKGAVQAAKADPRAADTLANAVLGSAALSVAAGYAARGYLTGPAPQDAAKRDAFFASGKKPWSLRVGDQWVSYQNAGPLAAPFVVAAAMHDRWQNMGQPPDESQVAHAVRVVSSGFLNGGVLYGMRQNLDALEHGDSQGAALAWSQVGRAVPFGALMRNVAQAGDPILRSPEQWYDHLYRNLPELSKRVPPRLTVMDGPARRSGSEGAKAFLPGPISPERRDPTRDELTRLGIFPGFAGRTLHVGREARALIPAEQREYQELLGAALRETVGAVIASPAYRALTRDETKKKALETYVGRARRQAADQLRARLLERTAR